MSENGRNGIPRVGVYVCSCGTNIAGTVDVKAVAEYAATLPGVVASREYKYVCSEPGQQLIQQDIRDHKLERVVVASCSPRMHEATFQNAVAKAGLNPFCFAISLILPIPNIVLGSCMTPIFQSKTFNEFILGNAPLTSGPSMFP